MLQRGCGQVAELRLDTCLASSRGVPADVLQQHLGATVMCHSHAQRAVHNLHLAMAWALPMQGGTHAAPLR